MAITPRTILTSAAPATVAVVSLYFFTVLGTAAFKIMSDKEDAALLPMTTSQTIDANADMCGSAMDARFGDKRSEWSEYAWINYAHCFDQLEDSHNAIAAAGEGLRFHPRSEILYNIKGYHQIVIGENSAAIDTLRQGMEAVVHQRNGVMSNNLAWAGLWEPRQMRLDEARQLYTRSLSQSPGLCETIHTGLFVEFAMARQAHGFERYDALQRFGDLRARYSTTCLNRLETGDWHTTLEIVGAAAVFDSLDNIDGDEVSALLRRATAKLHHEYGHVTAEEVCTEAIPMADFHHQCIDAVERGLEVNALANRNHEERNRRAQESREVLNYYGHDHAVIRANPNQPRGCSISR